MPNPWDRQPRETPNELPPDAGLPCPVCAETTDSLKQYRFLHLVVFLLAGAWWQVAHYRACPSCMRRWVVRRSAYNLLPANLLWPFLVLPWGLGLIVACSRKGHSRAVLTHVTPELAALREVQQRAAAEEVSWSRVWAIIAILVCWLPAIGLPFALVAFFLNRRADNWQKPASILALVVNVLVTVGLVVAILASG